RDARRAAGRAADPVRARRQFENREGDRPRVADVDSTTRRRGDRMKRREFIALLGGAAAWPLAARAQQPGRVVRIGFVGPAIDRPSLMFVPNYQAFLAQLHVLGFVEGQNLIVTYGAVDDPRGLAVVAAELMQVQPELIVVSGTEPMLQSV